MKHTFSLLVTLLILLSSLLTILSFTGCGNSDPIAEAGTLSTEERTEIGRSIGGIQDSRETKYDTVWYDEDDALSHYIGCRYYGTYHGYSVIMKPYIAKIKCDIDIAGKTFSHVTPFELVTYNGNHVDSVRPLDEVYEARAETKFTKRDIEKILRIHTAYEEKYEIPDPIAVTPPSDEAVAHAAEVIGTKNLKELRYLGECGRYSVFFDPTHDTVFADLYVESKPEQFAYCVYTGWRLFACSEVTAVPLGELYRKGELSSEDFMRLLAAYCNK